MKTIPIAFVMSLLALGAANQIVNHPESVPNAVWDEIPSLPGAGLSDADLQDMNRRFASPLPEKEARRFRRLRAETGMPNDLIQRAAEANSLPVKAK